jgi:hypothetical protein
MKKNLLTGIKDCLLILVNPTIFKKAPDRMIRGFLVFNKLIL